MPTRFFAKLSPAWVLLVVLITVVAALFYLLGSATVQHYAVSIGPLGTALTAFVTLLRPASAPTIPATPPRAPTGASVTRRWIAMLLGLLVIWAAAVGAHKYARPHLISGPIVFQNPTAKLPASCDGYPAYVAGVTPTKESFDLQVRICQPPPEGHQYWLMVQRKRVYLNYDAFAVLYNMDTQAVDTTKPWPITITVAALINSQRIYYVATAPSSGGTGMPGYSGDTAQWMQQNLDNKDNPGWDNSRHTIPADVTPASNSFTHTVG
jgi:hypothetical protein